MGIVVNITAFYCSLFLLKLTLPFSLPVGTPVLALLLVFYARYICRGGGSVPLSREIMVIYLFLTAFMLWGAVNSDRLYYNFLRDFRNAITILLLIPVFGTICREGLLDDFKEAFVRINSTAFFLVSLYSLYKFYMLMQGVELGTFIALDVDDIYPMGTSLQPDYNMSSIGLLSGFLSAVWLFCYRGTTTGRRGFYAISAVSEITAALFTGSRRAVVVFVIMVSALLLYQLGRGFHITRAARFIGDISAKFAIAIAVFVPLILCGAQLYRASDLSGVFADEDNIQVLGRRYESLGGGIDTFNQSRGWHFHRAMELIDDMTIPQLIYGGGFDYLGKMSIDNQEDYPHNPALSAILYGGVFNCALTLFFIGRSLFLYIRNIRAEQFFLMLLILHLLFLLISSNTIFSSRSFIVLLVLPFIFTAVASDRGASKGLVCRA